MTVPSGRQHLLRAHDQELTVVEVGGGIRAYSVGGRPVLDGYGEAEMCSGGRGQLLAPWPNRLTGGAFEWEGRTLQGALSEPGKGNAIHGLVRWSAWTLESSGAAEARMVYRLHPQPGWPWTLDLAVDYRLTPTGLEVRTVITNVSDEPAPAGFGWHPYLLAFGATVDDAVVEMPAATAYTTDDRGRPTGRRPVAGTDLDFTAGRRVGDARLDTCFTDLTRDGSGRAVVTLTGGAGGGATETRATETTALWVDGSFGYLMLFTGDTLADADRRRRGLAVEPMTAPPDMLRSGEGRVVLAPGERLEGTWGVARL